VHPDVVDAHVHLLPPRLQAAIRSFFERRGFDSQGFAYPADPGEVCDRLAAEGISEAWTLPYARRPGSAEELNKSVASLVAGQRGGPLRLTGGCTVHPADDQPLTVLRSAVEDMGLRVLKLHCSVGDFQPDDRRLGPVWEYVSAAALPVVLHAGHAARGTTDAAELAPVEEVARRYPAARVIIAHCAHPATAAALRLVAEYPGVHADLTPVIDERAQVPAGQLAALAGKLLYGSDAPNTALPVTQLLDGLSADGLPPAARDLITGGTARRLQSEIQA
jgi:uncharacterized protein